ncbi:acid protease [Penicillium atrosanguineum]|nr:acid protease [Penicillium atrosanguineum]
MDDGLDQGNYIICAANKQGGLESNHPNMLTTSIFLGALGLIPMCSAVPHYVPSRIDLNHRPVPGMRHKYGIETISEANLFWFGSFDVGSSKNLTLLVDTGSADVIVNPGLYKKGSRAIDINENFTITYATTKSDGSGSGTVTGQMYNDTVKFGSMEAHQTVGSADGTALIPADGIVGFAGLAVSSFHGAAPFFHSLCQQGQVADCRFGITLWEDGKGTQVLGALDKSLFKGELTTASVVIQEWALYADIALDNKIIKSNALVELDTGTATVIGPFEEVIEIFKASGIQAVVQTTEDSGTTIKSVTGYFPCNQPPIFGFSIPSRKNATAAAKQHSKLVSHRSSIFNIAPDQWIAADNGNNNCTAIVSGTSSMPVEGLWVVGQPFFHGTYVDHNLKDGTLGFAPANC